MGGVGRSIAHAFCFGDVLMGKRIVLRTSDGSYSGFARHEHAQR